VRKYAKAVKKLYTVFHGCGQASILANTKSHVILIILKERITVVAKRTLIFYFSSCIYCNKNFRAVFSFQLAGLLLIIHETYGIDLPMRASRVSS